MHNGITIPLCINNTENNEILILLCEIHNKIMILFDHENKKNT